MAERIVFPTRDGIDLAADWVTAPTTMGAVILIHAMPATRQSWAAFQRVLARRGLASLAFDLRGHGESTHARDGSVLDFKKFAPNQQSNSIEDVQTAFTWVRRRGVEPSRIALAGASIGANLALQFLAEEPQIPAAALLSPGIEYQGVNALEFAPNILPHQAVWMAGSSGDDDESAQAVKALDGMLKIERKAIEKPQQAGHATALFESDPAMMDRIADWLHEQILHVH